MSNYPEEAHEHAREIAKQLIDDAEQDARRERETPPGFVDAMIEGAGDLVDLFPELDTQPYRTVKEPSRDGWIRTWHLEMCAVAAVLATVAIARGMWTEWLATGAVLATFGHASIAERLREREAARDAAAVSCYRWLDVYYVAKELLWVAFFVVTSAYVALVGCAVFLAYPVWRRWWRRRHPLGNEPKKVNPAGHHSVLRSAHAPVSRRDRDRDSDRGRRRA